MAMPPLFDILLTRTKISGHGGSVNWLGTFSDTPGTLYIVSGSDDRTVRVWRRGGTAGLQECCCLRGFPDPIVAGSLASGNGIFADLVTLTVASGPRILRAAISVNPGSVEADAPRSLLVARDDIGGLAVSGVDGCIVAADEDGDVSFVDAALTLVTATARAAHSSLGSCADAALLPDELGEESGSGGGAWTAVTGGTDHTLLVWDWGRRRVVGRVPFGGAAAAPPAVIEALDAEAEAAASLPPPPLSSAQRKRAAKERKATKAAPVPTKASAASPASRQLLQSASVVDQLRAADESAAAASEASPSRLFNPPFVHAVAFSPASWEGGRPPALAVALGDGRLVCLEVAADGNVGLLASQLVHRAAVVAVSWGVLPFGDEAPVSGKGPLTSSTGDAGAGGDALGGAESVSESPPYLQPSRNYRCLVTAGNDGDIHVWGVEGLWSPSGAPAAGTETSTTLPTRRVPPPLPLLASIRHGRGPNAVAVLPSLVLGGAAAVAAEAAPLWQASAGILVADATSRLSLYTWGTSR